jgi:hypothetical protein
MKRFGLAILFGICGYFIAAFAGYWLIGWFSSNRYDPSVEAAMTTIFVVGPLGAIVAFIIGFVRMGRGKRVASDV